MQKWQPENDIFYAISAKLVVIWAICVCTYLGNVLILHSISIREIMRRFVTLIFALSTMTLMAQTPINIIIGSKTFTATLADSEGQLYIRYNGTMYNVQGEIVYLRKK